MRWAAERWACSTVPHSTEKILAAIVTGWGMLPRAARSATEALEWLRAGEEYDVAVLDMHMPEKDGLMLAREIRQLPGGTGLPLVLLSSLGMRDVKAEKELFTAALTKPVKPSQLFDVLAGIFKEALCDVWIHTAEGAGSLHGVASG